MTIAERLTDLNRWYEGLPDDRRVFVYPGVLLAAALVNAKWTGSPFGCVFFAAVAALVVVRKLYPTDPDKAEAQSAKPTPAPRQVAAQPDAVQPVAKPAPVPAAPPVPVAPAVAAKPAAPPVPPAPPVVAQSAPKPAAPSAPVAPPVAAQPARAVVQPKAPAATPPTPTVDAPAPRPVAAVEPKKPSAPPPRRNDGRSGRRKPGDKHPH